MGESRIVSFDRDVNARDPLGIVIFFIINIQSHANNKNERLLVSFHFMKYNEW